ncbi:hypothetical protein ACVWXU_004377 [Streptomyces sp. TE33382]
MPGDLGRCDAVRVGEFARGVRGAGEVAAQPHAHRVGQRLHPEPEQIDGGGGGQIGQVHRVVDHRPPARGVQHHQMRPAEAARDQGEPGADRRVGGVGPALGQLVDADAAGVRVHRQGGGDGAQRLAEPLAPQQFRLVPGVGDQLDPHPHPGVREERLVAVLEEAPDPGPYGDGVGQQPLGELHLLRAAGRRQVQRPGPHGVAHQRGRRPGPVQTGTGELQRGGHEPLVVQPVEDVQVLGEGRPGPAVAAADPGERHEDVGERVAPEELRLQQPVREVGFQRGGGRGRPAVQARVVARLGERVQGQPQLREGRGFENDAVRAQARDVDGHAHPSIVRVRERGEASLGGHRQSAGARPLTCAG